jgi:hypothetical protein
MAAPTVPTVISLTRALGGSPGVVIRPFADQAGTVVVTRAAVYFVEVEPGLATDRTADWLYRLDHALRDRPGHTAMVRTEGDIAAVVATVNPTDRG